MQLFEIPLTPTHQSFQIALGGQDYVLTLIWRGVPHTHEHGWLLDIADSVGRPIISGIPLVTGADLLAQHRHLGIPGGLWVQTDHNADAVPAYVNLGRTAHLYFARSL